MSNLRYLEKDIDTLDHQIFQVDLKLGHTPTSIDELGFQHGKTDACALDMEDVMTRQMKLKMRELILAAWDVKSNKKHDR